MRVDREDAKDPGNAKYWKKHSHCFYSKPETKYIGCNMGGQGLNFDWKNVKKKEIVLDCIGISVNSVALSADPRYDPGDGY